MATRRPTDTPRAPDTSNELPKVATADDKGPQAAAPKSRPSRTRKPAKNAPGPGTISQEVRRSMIAEGAYLRAERRGFAPGNEEEDWLAAEAEVDGLLRARHIGTSH